MKSLSYGLNSPLDSNFYTWEKIDKNPEKQGRYLIFISDPTGVYRPHVRVGSWDMKQWHASSFPKRAITHWCELPHHPK